MTGDIACGAGLLCTGNIISATGGGGGGGSPGGPNNSIQFNNLGSFDGSANLTWVSPKLSIGAVGTTGELGIVGTTSGNVTQTVQAVAGTPTVTWGTSSGTPVVTASAPLAITAATGDIVVTGAAGQILAGATPAFTATPTLGASGTLGSVTFGNASSGLLTLKTVTGALGSVTLNLPAANDTLVGKATTDTFTNKTFDTAGTGNSLLINGLAATSNVGTGSVVRATSPTLVTPNIGVATATSVNGLTISASTGTLTIGNGKTLTSSNSLTFTGTDGTSFAFPSTSDTVVVLGVAQTLTNKTLTSPTINGGMATALTGLAIRSTGSAFDLTFANSEVFTAGRTLTYTLNNANRAINISGNITTAADFITAGSNSLTLTTTAPTNVTLPTSGTLVNSAVTTLSNLSSIGTITTGIWQGTAVGLGFGGTGQTSAVLARTSSGLNIDEVSTFGNANYNASASDRTIATSASFTAQRTITLPTVASFNAGQQLTVLDSFGAINGANTLVISANGADTINGVSSVTITAQYSGAVLWPVGSNKWGYIASASGGGSGTVTSVSPSSGLTSTVSAVAPGSPITTSGSLYSAQTVNAQSGTSYSIQNDDRAKLITFSNSAAQAVTIPQAGASSEFQTGWYADIRNKSTGLAGIVTITPTTSTIGGAATYVLGPGSAVRIVSDGTNYQIASAGGKSTNPTAQVFTSSSGTYTTPNNTKWIKITLIGGGGGGGGGNNAAAATNGGDTCWNTTGAACTTPVYDAGGGTGGAHTSIGTGGAISGSGSCTWSVVGGAGQFGVNSIAATLAGTGGIGGVSYHGSPGTGGKNSAATNAAANSGSGGGGGGLNATATLTAGSGGGSGASCEVIINSPAASYTYAVGTGGGGAAAGTNGFAGGDGGSGVIIVEEHYNY